MSRVEMDLRFNSRRNAISFGLHLIWWALISRTRGEQLVIRVNVEDGR